MQPIASGEEICFDYAMCDSTPYDEFECVCGVPLCRGRVTQNDWTRPELQNRYQGYFSPYLARRIAALSCKVEFDLIGRPTSGIAFGRTAAYKYHGRNFLNILK